MEYDNLDTNHGITIQEGWVNFDYIENTDELSDLFEEPDINLFIE